MKPHRDLSELLREEGLIDEQEAMAARRRSRREGVAFARAVLEGGRLTEAQYLETLERRLQIPRVELSTTFADEDAVREVSHDVATDHCLLPLDIEHKGTRSFLRVAMANPLDWEAIEEIEASSGYHIDMVLAAPSELTVAIEKAYRGMVTKLIPRGSRKQHASTSSDEEATRPMLVSHAPIDAQLQAVIELLVSKGVISETEYVEALERILSR